MKLRHDVVVKAVCLCFSCFVCKRKRRSESREKLAFLLGQKTKEVETKANKHRQNARSDCEI